MFFRLPSVPSVVRNHVPPSVYSWARYCLYPLGVGRFLCFSANLLSIHTNDPGIFVWLVAFVFELVSVYSPGLNLWAQAMRPGSWVCSTDHGAQLPLAVPFSFHCTTGCRRTSGIIGKCSSTGLHHQPSFGFFILQHKLTNLARLSLNLPYSPDRPWIC